MDEQKIRQQICDICHCMWQQGWVAANDGNVSQKLPDGTYLVTPTGVSKRLITPEMLVHIDVDGEILNGEMGYFPSSEIKMHLRCYEERSDINGVVHAHPPAATGFAVAGFSMDDYSMIETVVSLGSIPLTPYGTPSTSEVPDAITPFLAEHDAMLLENHGALTIGESAMNAYYKMETVELYARISLNASLLGGAKEIEQHQINKLLELRRNYYKVSGRHPGYKKYNSCK